MPTQILPVRHIKTQTINFVFKKPCIIQSNQTKRYLTLSPDLKITVIRFALIQMVLYVRSRMSCEPMSYGCMFIGERKKWVIGVGRSTPWPSSQTHSANMVSILHSCGGPLFLYTYMNICIYDI